MHTFLFDKYNIWLKFPPWSSLSTTKGKKKNQEIDSFCYKGKSHEYIHDVWLLNNTKDDWMG